MRLDTARLTPERAADIVLDQLPRAGVVDTTSYGRLPPSLDVGGSQSSVARVGAGDAVVAPAGCDRLGDPVSLAGSRNSARTTLGFRDDSTAGQGWHAPLRARCAEAAPAGTVRSDGGAARSTTTALTCGQATSRAGSSSLTTRLKQLTPEIARARMALTEAESTRTAAAQAEGAVFSREFRRGRGPRPSLVRSLCAGRSQRGRPARRVSRPVLVEPRGKLPADLIAAGYAQVDVVGKVLETIARGLEGLDVKRGIFAPKSRHVCRELRPEAVGSRRLQLVRRRRRKQQNDLRSR